MVDGQADADRAGELAEKRAAARAELERRLAAGEWLTIPEVATLFGVHRNTAHRWATVHKKIRVRPSSPAGGTAALLCNPADVQTLLRKTRGEEE